MKDTGNVGFVAETSWSPPDTPEDNAAAAAVFPDMVNQPPHYTNSPAKCSGCGKTIECIDITRHMPFNLGNVIKYVWRLGKKGSDIEQLEKAAFYLADEIALRKERSS